jgi:hypothetical protein
MNPVFAELALAAIHSYTIVFWCFGRLWRMARGRVNDEM